MPTKPTINDIQQVAPIIQNLFLGYSQDETRFIASRVFPPVTVPNDDGTYYIATKKHWFLDDMPRRAPGDPFQRTGFGIETASFTTKQYATAHEIPDEHRANSQVPMDLEQIGAKLLMQRNMINMERKWAAAFMINNAWETTDNNSTTDWDDFAAGDPVADIQTAVDTISNSTGKEANTIALGRIVHKALVNHPDLLDRIKYTAAATRQNITSALAELFGLENYLVARGSFSDTNEAVAFSASTIIDDDALIMHVNPSASIFDVTAGKTFFWPGGGGMGMTDAWREPANKQDVISLMSQFVQKAVATDLGYLFLDVV